MPLVIRRIIISFFYRYRSCSLSHTKTLFHLKSIYYITIKYILILHICNERQSFTSTNAIYNKHIQQFFIFILFFRSGIEIFSFTAGKKQQTPFHSLIHHYQESF